MAEAERVEARKAERAAPQAVLIAPADRAGLGDVGVRLGAFIAIGFCVSRAAAADQSSTMMTAQPIFEASNPPHHPEERCEASRLEGCSEGGAVRALWSVSRRVACGAAPQDEGSRGAHWLTTPDSVASLEKAAANRARV